MVLYLERGTDYLHMVQLMPHTHPFNSPFPGLPGLARTRKVKPIWILLKQETVSGSGISWAYASLHIAPDSPVDATASKNPIISCLS